MTNADWILSIQASILFLTCAVIVWYTIETFRIRRATQLQNTYLAEQLRIMQEQYRSEQQHQKSLLKPLLKFNGGKISGNEASSRFINKGGTARKLSLKYDGDYSMGITPTRILEPGAEVSISIRAINLSQLGKILFQIECFDIGGTKYTFNWSFTHGKGFVDEDDEVGE